MKLLIISDTHGYISNAVSLINQHKPDYVIHLGDMAEDCDDLMYTFPMQKMICVLGNNDWYNRKYPFEIITTICNKKFFMCHGHKYNVKYGIELLKKRAAEEKADIVLFGHTHSRYIETKDNKVILNPGSTSSYGLIEIDSDGNVNAQVFDA